MSAEHIPEGARLADCPVHELCALRWRCLTNFPFYRISEHGHVWSERRLKLVKPAKRHGYYFYHLTVDGSGWNVQAHKLVCLAFIGLRPTGYDICHNNGDRTDNRVENLRYDTRKGNMRDQYLHGTRAAGSRSGTARFNPDQVKEIVRLASGGKSRRSIAQLFGTNTSEITNIVIGRTYRAERAAA